MAVQSAVARMKAGISERRMIVQVVSMVPSQHLEAVLLLVCLGRPLASSVAARRKRYALVIEIVPPSWNVHRGKQTLYPSSLPLAETICPFVTNFTIKKREGQKCDF